MTDGWTHSTLGQVAKLTIGRTPPRAEARYWTKELHRPFCTIADMGEWTINPRREGVTEAAEASGKAKRVPAGSMLMSFKLTIGRVGFAACDVFPNEAIVWISVHDRALDESFLALYLTTQDLTATSGRAVKGNTLNTASLNAIPVRFPSLAEQRRIVDLIRAVDRAVDLAGRHATAVEGVLAALRESVVAPVAPLDQLLDRIEAGSSPMAIDRAPELSERGVLKVSAVKPGVFVPSEAKALHADTVMSERARLRVGDVLITRANTTQLVGAVCQVKVAAPNLFLCDKTLRLILNDASDADYIVHVMRRDDVRRQIEVAATGTSGSMKNISQAAIRGLRIPMPSVGERANFGELMGAASEAAAAVRSYRQRLTQLRGSLLSELLTGAHTVPDSYDALLDGTA